MQSGVRFLLEGRDGVEGGRGGKGVGQRRARKRKSERKIKLLEPGQKRRVDRVNGNKLVLFCQSNEKCLS